MIAGIVLFNLLVVGLVVTAVCYALGEWRNAQSERSLNQWVANVCNVPAEAVSEQRRAA